jgi:hypothetical protein
MMVTMLKGKRDKDYPQNIYFLLHGHNPTTIPNNDIHELLDVNVYKYAPECNM